VLSGTKISRDQVIDAKLQPANYLLRITEANRVITKKRVVEKLE
jgi:hypothetical protein